MHLSVNDFMARLQPLAPDAVLGEAAARFAKAPHLPGLPVTLESAPIGVINRASVFEAIANDPKARRRPVVANMSDAFVLAVSGEPTNEMAKKALRQSPERLSSGAVIVEKGRYVGFIPANVLTLLLAREHAATTTAIEAQKSRIKAAESALAAHHRDHGRFLSILGNELRTPLTGVLGAADLLSDATSDRDTRLWADRISASAAQIDRVLADLLEHARLKVGGVEAAPTAVGLREFAKAVQATWSVELEASDGPLKIATAPGAVDRLSLDVRRTRQILYALSCALSKRAGKGGLKAVIDAQPKADQTIAYSMTIGFAQGGLSADERDHLEKQVSRSRHVRHPAGEFLGFSVAQKLAAVLGGHVTLLDGQGGGIVRYEADVRRARPELAVNNPNAPRMANFDLGDILLVDANEISQLVVSTALSAAGWRVQAASSAEQAIELINTTSFQAAIVDLMLPRPGGDAFVRALRENQENMTIPRLALAADGSDERRAACLRAGFVDVIEKPIRPRQLVATLADAIMASDAARAAARHSA